MNKKNSVRARNVFDTKYSQDKDNFETVQSIYEDLQLRLRNTMSELALISEDMKLETGALMTNDGEVGIDSLEIESARDAIKDATTKITESISAISDFEDVMTDMDDDYGPA